MALTGNYTHFTYVESDQTDEVTVTYPDNLPIEDPNYDKKGTTETISVPRIIEQENLYENIYLIVRAASLHQRVGADQVKINYVSMLVSIYNDLDHKTNDFLNEVYHDVIDEVIDDLTELNASDNIMSFCYNLLKTKPGFENLIDA